jgi:putative transposase
LEEAKAVSNQKENERRCYAIQLYEQGIGFSEILRIVRRSKGWLAKWIKRYKEEGSDGLRDRSRAPRKVWRKTPERIVRKVLAIRDELESHRTRRSAFSGIGPEVIHWELKQRKTKNIPSIPTISRLLCTHGKTNKAKPKRNSNNQPYPYCRATKMGDLQQTDLVGPRFLRGKNGVVRFYSFHTVDVAGHTVFTSQFNNKQTISFCRHLVETWRYLGLPEVSQVDNEMATSGGGRYQYSISQVIRLHLLLGIHLVFIPPREPGRNAFVESFNALWQDRVLQRHECPTIGSLRRTSTRFMQYYHYEKPHRGFTHKEHGTQFPGIIKDRLWKNLRHVPEEFSLDTYIDSNNQLKLPVCRGRVSSVRKVDSHGRIDVNGFPYFIRKTLEGQYVVATVFTHRRKLVIKQDNQIIKSFPFPVKDKIVGPLLSFTKKIS